MKKTIMYLMLLGLFPFLVYAQYFGGEGRGDVSILSGIILVPVQETKSGLPVKYELAQNYSNPFNASTKIKYTLPHNSQLVIKVYDAAGKEVATLLDEHKPAGIYELTWYTGNLSSGIYFCRMQTEGFAMIRKMVLLK